MGNDPASNDVVELRVPAVNEYAALVRLVAAALAADASFSVDDVDDVRLAVNEVFAGAVVAHEQQTPGVITVRYRTDGAGIDVEVVSQAGVDIVLDELAESIIGVAVDAVTIGSGTVLLSKRRPTAG